MAVRAGEVKLLSSPAHTTSPPGGVQWRLPCKTLNTIPKKIFKKIEIKFIDTQQYENANQRLFIYSDQSANRNLKRCNYEK
jgi:hypothetical protein